MTFLALLEWPQDYFGRIVIGQSIYVAAENMDEKLIGMTRSLMH